MSRKLLALVAATVLALTVTPVAGAEDGPSSVYLSLGTSLAAGTQADANGDLILFTDESYTDQLFDKIDDDVDQHVKLGCPGETTFTFTNGGICYTGGISQLSLAQATIAAGNVSLITIDMGANDILQATPALLACQGDPQCTLAILQGIAADVGAVLDAIRASDPTIPIVGMNYYNPNLAAWLGYFSGVPGQLPPDPGFAILTQNLAIASNAMLTAEFAVRGIPVADVFAAYKGNDFDTSKDEPKAVKEICKLTYMCPDLATATPDIHPTKDGYKKIRDAFNEIVKHIEL